LRLIIHLSDKKLKYKKSILIIKNYLFLPLFKIILLKIIKLNIILISILLLYSSSIIGQNNNVSLRILDAKDNIPLIGVNVIIKGTTIGTISNNEGYAYLNNVPDKCLILRISHTGYTTIEEEIKSITDSTFTFYMEESIYDLNSVVVTATRTEKTLKNVPVLTQVISAKQLETSHLNDINEILESYVPSIDFSRASFGTNMTMQGLDAKYILFLIDGERIAGETKGNIDYSLININDIERIEILKGASSSLYGSQAIGGVINIITKEVKHPFESSIYSQISKYKDLNSSGIIGFNIKNVTSKTQFDFRRMDGYDLTPEEPYNNTIDKYYNYSVSQTFTYNPIDAIKIKLKTKYYNQERFKPELWPIPVHPKYYDLNYQLKANYSFNKGDLDASWFSDTYETFDVYELSDDETKSYSNKLNNARIICNYNLGQKQVITTGTELFLESLYSDRIKDTIKNISDLIFFAQDDIKITSKFNSILGFRINNHSTYGFHATPQLSFMYRLSPFKLRASYSAGYKSPTLKELYMDFSPIPIIYLHGNENLKPEISNYYSASIEYSKSNVNGSLSYYHNRVKNMIVEVNDLNSIEDWYYTNIDKKTIVNGLELTFYTKLNYGFSLNGIYNYNRTKIDTINLQVWGIYTHSAVFTIVHEYKRKKYRLTTSLNCKYLGDLFYHRVDQVTAERTVEIIPRHTIWRLVMSQQFIPGINIKFGIDNIFNFSEKEYFIGINPGRRFFTGINIDIHKIKLTNKN
jgi:outer membrane receptor for ferrienterochelin and colicins